MTQEKKRKKKGSRALSAVEQRELEDSIRNLIGKNYSDLQILKELNLQPHILAIYKDRIIDSDRDSFQKLDNAKVYSDYLLKSRQMIKELNHMQKRFSNRGQWTALVAAVKLKKEIYDSTLKHGQDFGFIEKKASEIKVQGEMSFSHYSKEEVKAELEKEIENMNRIAKGNVIEMRPEILDALDADTEKIQKYVPANVKIPDKKVTKKSKKVKVKLTMRK